MTADWKVAYANRDAAKYATKYWHYSGTLPSASMYVVGVWEASRFIGVIIFSKGATLQIGSPYGLPSSEVVELTRIALAAHDNPVSMYMSAAVKLLKRDNPRLRLIVSYADPSAGHHGGIYQAAGWVYVGEAGVTNEIVVNGKQMHLRSIHSRGWSQKLSWIQEHIDPRAVMVRLPGKHKYLYPLDKQMRRKVERLRVPAPGRLEAAGEVRR